MSNIETVYHIFTDGRDEWTTNFDRAVDYYCQFAKQFHCARLYIEVYSDRENDVMEHEDCLMSFGSYPM